MSTPLYSTDIIPMTSRPTLTVIDDGDYFVILDTSTGKISKILKTNIMTALKITYDNTSGLTAETVQAALDELVVNLGSSDSAIATLQTTVADMQGTGYTEGSLKSHEDRLDTLEGTGAGSVADDIFKYAVKLTKMPDGATAVYSQDEWVTSDGWSPSGGTISITALVGSLRLQATGATPNVAKVNILSAGKIAIIRYRSSKNITLKAAGGFSFSTLKLSADFTVAVVQIPAKLASTTAVISLVSSASGDILDIDWLWIGDYSYLDNSLATEASRISNQLGDTAGVGTKASGTLTSNGTNVSDGDTVTIAGKAYTFKTILGTTEGNVLIGGTAAESLDNLKLAINSTGVTAEQYCATFHPLVEATTNTDTMQTLVARSVGILGNSITLTKSATTLTLSGSTLSGGTDDVGQKIYTQVKDIVAGGTRPAQADISDTSTIVGYENSVDVASGGTTTLPAGGTFRWAVYGYGATIASAKKGTSAGGTTLTVAGANATVWYRRIA